MFEYIMAKTNIFVPTLVTCNLRPKSLLLTMYSTLPNTKD
jgi:hypothetical protein